MGDTTIMTELVLVSLKTCCLRNYIFISLCSLAAEQTELVCMFMLGNYIKCKLSLKTANTLISLLSFLFSHMKRGSSLRNA